MRAKTVKKSNILILVLISFLTFGSTSVDTKFNNVCQVSCIDERNQCVGGLQECLDAVEEMDTIIPTIYGGEWITWAFTVACGNAYIDCINNTSC